MTETPWTPGPWMAWIEGEVFEPQGEVAWGGDHCVVYRTRKKKFAGIVEERWLQIPNTAANVRLQAKAPEMAELLEALVARLDRIAQANGWVSVTEEEARAKALLAGIKGERQ